MTQIKLAFSCSICKLEVSSWRQDELISLDMLCELLKVRKSYIYKLISRNIIPFYRIGGLKFKLREVEVWIEQNKIKSAQPKTIERLLKEI